MSSDNKSADETVTGSVTVEFEDLKKIKEMVDSHQPDFETISPDEFVQYIDAIFLVQKKRILEHILVEKPPAFDDRYVVESATMNKVLRKRIQGNKEEPERSQLCWAHSYWWNRTHMLESLAKSKVGGIKTKKDIERGGLTLKNLIRGEQSVKDVHPEFLKLIDKLTSTNPQLPHSVA
jgi:hypothetical protein